MTPCLMLDVDGVLVNGRLLDGRSWAFDLERDLGLTVEELQRAFFKPHWPEVILGRKSLLDALESCAAEFSRPVSPRALIDYWFENDAAVDEAVLADCARIRASGARIFLATNQEHMRARFLMERLGLGDHVDGMIHSAGVGARKPQPAFYAAALARSGSTPGEIMLVDDDQANVDGAIAAGWSAALWTKGARLADLFQPT